MLIHFIIKLYCITFIVYLNNITMTLEELKTEAEIYLRKSLSPIWDSYTDGEKKAMIYGYCQGYLSCEIEEGKKRILTSKTK